MQSRILKDAENQITMGYQAHLNRGMSGGIDVVKNKYQLAYITAHSDGVVIAVVDYVKGKEADAQGLATGNYILIKHDTEYCTRYCHLKYGSIKVKVGDKVSKGQIIAYMGASGSANGAHLHFEVRKYSSDPEWLTLTQMIDKSNFSYIDPTSYINSDIPKASTPTPAKKSNEEIAKEVIAGKWGNGATRSANLKAAGYDYVEIQAIVKQLLTPAKSTPKAGDKVTLKDAPKYSSAKGSQIGTITGTYYLWDATCTNKRYRVTTRKEYVGVAGKVTCWTTI